MENPYDLWMALRNRYNHQKEVLLPNADFAWKNLRFQDFGKVEDYNSELFKIVSILKLCEREISDAELLEKTLSTFHSSNILLQQQYRERRFKTFPELMACLLVAEQNNELLLMNSAMRPAGSAPVPETSKKESKESNFIQRNAYQGQGRGKWNGRGGGRGYNPRNQFNGNSYGHPQGGPGRGNRSGFNRGRGRSQGITKPPHSNKSPCSRCGMNNHHARICRTPKIHADLYQEKMNRKAEINMVNQDIEGDFGNEEDSINYETSDLLKGDD